MIEQVEDKPRKRIRELSPEELRAYKRSSMEKSRTKKRAEQEAEKAIEATLQIDDVQEFWAASRKALSADELAALQAKQELVRDQLWWMRCWSDGSYNDPNSPHYCDPKDDQCYVGLEEGVADLVDFVRENPCPHLGAIFKSEEIPYDWGIRKFWADPKSLALLYAEGEATATYVRTGLLVGVPDWQVYRFLVDRAGWSHDQASNLLGYKTNSKNRVSYGVSS